MVQTASSSGVAMDSDRKPPPYPVEALRRQFPVLGQEIHGRPLVYLDNAATTQKPDAVIDCVRRFYQSSNSNIHRGVHTLSERASEVYENARERVRQFIHAASAQEVVFTFSTTDAINLLAQSFAKHEIGTGDEVLVSGLEHHSNLLPWQDLCRRNGATLRVLPLDRQGGWRMDELPGLLSDRTRLVAVSHVSNVLATVNPVREVIRLAHERDIPVLLDGAQAAQHLSVDVQELDCDFYVFSGHKCYAETGIGVLYGKEAWLDRLPPSRLGGGMVKQVRLQDADFAGLPLKFEAGTPNYVGAASLHAALDFVDGIGLDAISAHERGLTQRMADRLAGLENIQIHGNPAVKDSAVAFTVNGAHSYDVGMILDKLGIAVRTGHHCAQPLMEHFGVEGMVRASVGLYNREEDIDALIHGVERAARMLVG